MSFLLTHWPNLPSSLLVIHWPCCHCLSSSPTDLIAFVVTHWSYCHRPFLPSSDLIAMALSPASHTNPITILCSRHPLTPFSSPTDLIAISPHASSSSPRVGRSVPAPPSTSWTTSQLLRTQPAIKLLSYNNVWSLETWCRQRYERKAYRL